MAYIYKIVNDINQRIYVGKTVRSIQERFKEHCRESKTERAKDRPLYRAMRKYGVEHFHIELVEETDKPEEREIYWIEKLNAYKNGYNATLGGDGRRQLDYNLIVETYKNFKCIKATAKYLDISIDSVENALNNCHIEKLKSGEFNKIKLSEPIDQYDKLGNFIQTFPSSMEAARTIRPNSSSFSGVASHIRDVCNGKRKTAYDFIWKKHQINE